MPLKDWSTRHLKGLRFSSWEDLKEHVEQQRIINRQRWAAQAHLRYSGPLVPATSLTPAESHIAVPTRPRSERPRNTLNYAEPTLSEKSVSGTEKDSEDEAGLEERASDQEFLSDPDEPMRDVDGDFVAEQSEQSTTEEDPTDYSAMETDEEDPVQEPEGDEEEDAEAQLRADLMDLTGAEDGSGEHGDSEDGGLESQRQTEVVDLTGDD